MLNYWHIHVKKVLRLFIQILEKMLELDQWIMAYNQAQAETDVWKLAHGIKAEPVADAGVILVSRTIFTE